MQSTTKQAIFKLGEEEYGLNIMDVNTIEKFIAIEPAVKLPKNFKGNIKLRGDVIPVYSLRRKFGLEELEPDEDTRFIITTSNEVLIAYEVDKMIEIVQIEPEQISEAPSILKDKNTSYLKSITNVHDRLVIILDHDGILSEEEQNKLKEINKSK